MEIQKIYDKLIFEEYNVTISEFRMEARAKHKRQKIEKDDT
jgi:hypothetical protein